MNIIISNAINEPIYTQIYNQIKAAIINGEIKEDQPLLSIRALAKELRISVITTKRAYDELEKDGFINTVAGKGSFVAPHDSELVREQHLREIERLAALISQEAQFCGLSKDELFEIIEMSLENI